MLPFHKSLFQPNGGKYGKFNSADSSQQSSVVNISALHESKEKDKHAPRRAMLRKKLFVAAAIGAGSTIKETQAVKERRKKKGSQLANPIDLQAAAGIPGSVQANLWIDC